jgi:hypothetical protein
MAVLVAAALIALDWAVGLLLIRFVLPWLWSVEAALAAR